MFDDIIAAKPKPGSTIKLTMLSPLADIESDKISQSLKSLLDSKETKCKWIGIVFNACWTQRLATFLFSRKVMNELLKSAADIGLSRRIADLSGREFKEFLSWAEENKLLQFHYRATTGIRKPAVGSLVSVDGKMLEAMVSEIGSDYIREQYAIALQEHSVTKLKAAPTPPPGYSTSVNESVNDYGNDSEEMPSSTATAQKAACRDIVNKPSQELGTNSSQTPRFSRGSRFSRSAVKT